jgi:diguanylate cyclase (GGDEF)-like protein
LLLDRATQMLARARRHATSIAAVLIEIDGFAAITDRLGSEAGDELLRAVALRLDSVVRDTDALGRLGGDKFVLLVEGATQPHDLTAIAERLRDALRAPFAPADERAEKVFVTASIGVATGSRARAADLISDAEHALRAAHDRRGAASFGQPMTATSDPGSTTKPLAAAG